MTPDQDKLARDVQEHEGDASQETEQEEERRARLSNIQPGITVEVIHEEDEGAQLDALLILLKRRRKRADAKEAD